MKASKQARTPQENGKVERFHGSIRREAGLPKTATVEEYRRRLEEYRIFFNGSRPHCSLGYCAPEKVYSKTDESGPDINQMIVDGFHAAIDKDLLDKISDEPEASKAAA